jgi:uncharacterized RDD family membrane protein YckC
MAFISGLHGLPDPERDRQFYAGVPLRRLAAWIVDVVLVTLLALTALLILAIPTFGLALLFSVAIGAATDFLYRVATLSQGSATPGMRLFGIELRDGAGNRLQFPLAAAHVLLTWVCFAVALAQLASAAMMAGTPRGQGLPDLLLGTAMINRPA